MHLEEAASERDGLLTADQIGEHLRNSSCGIPHLKKCEDTDGIIHGVVERGISLTAKINRFLTIIKV